MLALFLAVWGSSGSRCADDASWSAFEFPSYYTCAWWASEDPGCEYYKDYGQQSHCPATCGGCTHDQTERLKYRYDWDFDTVHETQEQELRTASTPKPHHPHTHSLL